MRYRGVLGEQRLTTDAKGEVAVKLPAAWTWGTKASAAASQRSGRTLGESCTSG